MPAPELPPEPGLAELGAEPDPGWSLESVESLVAALFLLPHLVAVRAGGPPDAFLPDEGERTAMARPAHAILQRSIRARALGRYGDGVALVTATGTYVASEADRVARYRADHSSDEPPPDVELQGLGVRAGDNVEQVRPWRPPAPEPE